MLSGKPDLQVGVICFLAHVGSFVPASRAVIGPINRILTRMHSLDTVLDGMSTFARDIAQVGLDWIMVGYGRWRSP